MTASGDRGPGGEVPGAELVDVTLGPHCVALLGEQGGKYPDANGLLVRGSQRTALIEPTLGVRRRLERGALAPLGPTDLVLLSHCHEDHVPALGLLEQAECWVHQRDRQGLQDLESFLDVFGYPPAARASFSRLVIERFHFRPRPDARAFDHEAVWDLGGVTIEAIHAPGHTPGHCFFRVEPDDVLYLGDVDLSTFGPYYGDAESSVDEFEQTLQMASTLEAEWYLTGHHKGVVQGSDTFRRMNERYLQVIRRREAALCEFLTQPKTLAEIVVHRFIYRSHDQGSMIDHVEEVSARLHLERLLRRGEVARINGDGADGATRYVRREE